MYSSFINEPSEIHVYDLSCHSDVQPRAVLLLQWMGNWLGGFFTHYLSSETWISTHACVQHDCTRFLQLLGRNIHGMILLIGQPLHLSAVAFWRQFVIQVRAKWLTHHQMSKYRNLLALPEWLTSLLKPILDNNWTFSCLLASIKGLFVSITLQTHHQCMKIPVHHVVINNSWCLFVSGYAVSLVMHH